jgi:hypothetical protein
MTVRLYDAQAHEWRLSWISQASAVIDVPVQGRWDDPTTGRFYCDDVHEGALVRALPVAAYRRGHRPVRAGVLRRRRTDLGAKLDHEVGADGLTSGAFTGRPMVFDSTDAARARP